MFRRFFYITAIIALLLTSNNSLATGFTTKRLHIISGNNTHEFTVEIADTPTKQERGLSHRKQMDKNHGMLFLFDKDLFGNTDIVNMWMKDTHLPLDMIFIKSGGVISKIATSTPLSTDIIPSEEPVTAVLELNAGTCERLGITKNDKVVLN